MPRAHRHSIPGCVWQITHRCHKQEFLLKFEKESMRWRHWLFEAKKRYGLCVLDYIATSNHTHMLVVDTGEDVIPQSFQLIAGRTAQEYNIRKKRNKQMGSFYKSGTNIVSLADIIQLRSFCCNPSLLLPEAGITSSKLQVFPDTLRELLDNEKKGVGFVISAFQAD